MADRLRYPLLWIALLILLAAIRAGLLRMGWVLPSLGSLTAAHGPLMVCGFLGTLIGLERAVALGRRWAYTAPLLSGLGAVTGRLGLPIGPWLLTAGSLKGCTRNTWRWPRSWSRKRPVERGAVAARRAGADAAAAMGRGDRGRPGIGASGVKLEAHRRVQRTAGGQDTIENLTALCILCHRAAHRALGLPM